MVAQALAAPGLQGHGEPWANALVLAAESGAILLLMAALGMGQLVNFVSHPVLTGFTSGAAILIVLSQAPNLLGLGPSPCGLNASLPACLGAYLGQFKPEVLRIGFFSLLGLIALGRPLTSLLNHLRLSGALITAISKSGPLLVIAAGALWIALGMDSTVVPTVGAVPAGIPAVSLRFLEQTTWWKLLPSALFIALIAYVESVAIAKATANIRRQRIAANQELYALGGANLAAALGGGMPVAGGFSRTMVNFSAGAQSQMATLITAACLALSVSYLTPWFASIPKAGLAAIVIVAVAPLIRLGSILETWHYQHADGRAQLVSLVGVLALGIEAGLVLAIVWTLLGHLWRTGHPHIAVVGRVPHTEHFRNVLRHEVETWPELLLIRVDEDLYFANAGFVEDFIAAETARHPQARHLVLIASAINHIDATALEMLEGLAKRLRAAGIVLHLAEVKGPVMDGLQRSDFLAEIAPGQVFFRTEDAIEELAGI
jgi:SulP family sulfate permease